MSAEVEQLRARAEAAEAALSTTKDECEVLKIKLEAAESSHARAGDRVIELAKERDQLRAALSERTRERT